MKKAPTWEQFVVSVGAVRRRILRSIWRLGFRDRGLGYGDYAILCGTSKRPTLVAELPSKQLAEHIIDLHNDHLKLHGHVK